MPTSISEFGTPSVPFQIAAGSDGNLYSTALLADAILRTTPGGTTTSIATGSGSHPLGITAGAASMFFTGASDIGELRLDTQAITHFALPAGSAPTGGIVAAVGDVWYTYAHGIGRLDTSTGAVTLYATAMAYSFPLRLTVGGDHKIWFTEANGDHISRLDPTTGSITQFALPESYSVPVGVTAGPDGNVWFVTMVGDNGDGVYRITPDGTLTAFHTPTAWSQPQAIVTGPDGNLWVAEYGTGKLAKVMPDGTMTEFDLPTAASGPYGITAGPGNTIWFTESSASKVGVVTLDVCPHSVSWDGGGDGVNWTDVVNWSADQLPGACDDVYIHTNPGVTIVHAAGSASIRSLHSDNAIHFLGSLTLATDSAVTKSLTMNGALTQSDGTLQLTGGGELTGNFHTGSATALIAFYQGVFTDQGTQFGGSGTSGTTRIGDGTGLRLAVYFVPLPDLPPEPDSLHEDNVELKAGGTIQGGGKWVQAAKTLTWTGGAMEGTGTTQINSGASLTVSGPDAKVLSRRNLVNVGRAQIAGGPIQVSNGATIINEFLDLNQLGSLDLTGASILHSEGDISTFVNNSYVTNSSGASTISINFVNNNGLLISDGLLKFDAPGTLTQNDASALLTIETNAILQVSDFAMAGGRLNGTGQFLLTNLMTWNGGTMEGDGNDGTTRIAANAVLNITGNVTINNRTVENRGSVSQTAQNVQYISGVFDNFGNYSIVGDQRMNALFQPVPIPIGTFNNFGRVVKSAGNGTASIRMDFNNAGLVEVASGTIDFQNDGTHTGQFKMTDATTGFSFSRRILFTEQIFNVGASFVGDGLVTVDDHVHFIIRQGVALQVQNFTIDENAGTDAIVGGDGDLSAHHFSWLGGKLAGAGTVTVNPGDVMDIGSNTGKFIEQLTILNYGTINWMGEGDIAMSQGASIISDGLGGRGNFFIENNQKILKPESEQVPTSQIIVQNGALLTKPIFSGMITEIRVSVKNDGGFVDLRANELRFTALYQQTGNAITRLGGGFFTSTDVVSIQGGIFYLDSGQVAASLFEIVGDGALAGSGTIISPIVHNAGRIEVGNAQAAGILNINGNYQQTAEGILHIEVGGNSAGTGFDQLNVTERVQLDGILEASLIGNFVPAVGATYKFLTFATRSGDFSDKRLQLGGGLSFDITYNANDLTFVTKGN
ncbi:MAG: hypothetical protein K2R98_24050 [Gemmataceae bacterium]|nr:hypothetical protein [Gemmataceae bacterium]